MNNWIDYAIISVVSFSCLIGLVRGFIREILSLITWYFALCVFNHYYTYLFIYFRGFKDKFFQNRVAILVLFMAALVTCTVINYLIIQLVKKADLLGTDRVLGGFFGAFRGILIVSTILLFLDSSLEFSKSDFWHESQFILWLTFTMKWLLNCPLFLFLLEYCS